MSWKFSRKMVWFRGCSSGVLKEMEKSGIMDVKIVFVTVASVVFLVRYADIRNNAQNASSSSSESQNFLCGVPLNKFDDSFSPMLTWRNFHDVSAVELFNFITHPDVVEKVWISYSRWCYLNPPFNHIELRFFQLILTLSKYKTSQIQQKFYLNANVFHLPYFSFRIIRKYRFNCQQFKL